MGFNILVVDDSSVMRAMIIKTLRLSGLPLAEVHQASNGAEGLQLLERNWIDVALIDVNMPVMDGEEMLDRIRQDAATANLPVVIISSEASNTRIGSFRQKGAFFVHKPFNPETIREIILNITGATNEQPERQTVQGGGTDF